MTGEDLPGMEPADNCAKGAIPERYKFSAPKTNGGDGDQTWKSFLFVCF